MSIRVTVSIVSLLFAVSARPATADCATLLAYQGTARIQITDAKPSIAGDSHLTISFSINSSTDAYLFTSIAEPDEIVVVLLEAPFFKGKHASALRCEHGLCERLSSIDFTANFVDADAILFIDCPDTGVAVNEIRLQFAELESGGSREYVPILSVRPK